MVHAGTAPQEDALQVHDIIVCGGSWRPAGPHLRQVALPVAPEPLLLANGQERLEQVALAGGCTDGAALQAALDLQQDLRCGSAGTCSIEKQTSEAAVMRRRL